MQDGSSVDRVPVPQALMMVAGGAAFIGLFFAIGGALGLASTFAGLFFVLQWGGIDKAEPKAFFPALIGALGGLAHGWVLRYAEVNIGLVGIVCVVLCFFLVLFLTFRAAAPWIFNPAYLLFFTLATVPPVAAAGDFPGMILAVLFAGAYFGSLALIAQQVKQRRAPAAGKA